MESKTPCTASPCKTCERLSCNKRGTWERRGWKKNEKEWKRMKRHVFFNFLWFFVLGITYSSSLAHLIRSSRAITLDDSHAIQDSSWLAGNHPQWNCSLSFPTFLFKVSTNDWLDSFHVLKKYQYLCSYLWPESILKQTRYCRLHGFVDIVGSHRAIMFLKLQHTTEIFEISLTVDFQLLGDRANVVLIKVLGETMPVCDGRWSTKIPAMWKYVLRCT